MDILLIQPPIRDFYLTAKRTIPYGLASIGASLKQAGFTVEILDALATGKSRPRPLPDEMSYLEAYYGKPDISPFCLFHGYRHFGYSFEHLKGQIRASGAFLVGISSLFTAYSGEARRVARMAKEALPGAMVVVGGHHPTALPGDVMEWGAVDYAIRGEGETALPRLAEAVRTGGDVAAVPGIVFRNPDGTLHVSPPAVMPNLDAVPPPDRSMVKNAFYTRGRAPSTVVVTSRGCPLGCSYCALGNRDLYPYRQRSVSAVLDEVSDAVENYGARFIDFEDENLSFSRKWFLSLLEAITVRFGPGALELRAMNGLYPPTLDEEVVVAMKAAGFKALNLSLGATCREQLGRFRRPDVRAAFDSCLDLAEKHSLDAVGYVICGAPAQQGTRSVEDLLYLAGRRVLAGLSVFYPAPGSQDYCTAENLGILPPVPALFRSSAIPLSHTTSRLESVTLMRLSRIVNFMKLVVDRGCGIPAPSALAPGAMPPDLDRFSLGTELLSAFLHDGLIRGVMPDGTIFTHLTDMPLARYFRDRLLNTPVRGTQG